MLTAIWAFSELWSRNSNISHWSQITRTIIIIANKFEILRELPNMTQRHAVSRCCWKNGAYRLAGHKVAANLPWWLRRQRIRLQYGRARFGPHVREIPWRRKRQPTPVPLPGEFHGQESDRLWATVHRVAKSWTQLSNWQQQQALMSLDLRLVPDWSGCGGWLLLVLFLKRMINYIELVQ